MFHEPKECCGHNLVDESPAKPRARGLARVKMFASRTILIAAMVVLEPSPRRWLPQIPQSVPLRHGQQFFPALNGGEQPQPDAQDLRVLDVLPEP